MSKVKNVTYSLPVELIERLKSYAKNNYINSVNSAVKEALEEYVKILEKKKLLEEMKKASQDPIFMKDLEENMKAFESSDIEVDGGDNEW